jgi:hypothetical protein
VYALNAWLWQFVHSKPRVVTVVRTSLIQRIGELLCYRMGLGTAMPRGPKESTRLRPGTPVSAENDMDWAKDIPGISGS